VAKYQFKTLASRNQGWGLRQPSLKSLYFELTRKQVKTEVMLTRNNKSSQRSPLGRICMNLHASVTTR